MDILTFIVIQSLPQSETVKDGDSFQLESRELFQSLVDDDDDDSVGGKLAVVDVVFEAEVTDRGQGERKRGRIPIKRFNGTLCMFYKGHLSREGQYGHMAFLPKT